MATLGRNATANAAKSAADDPIPSPDFEIDRTVRRTSERCEKSNSPLRPVKIVLISETGGGRSRQPQAFKSDQIDSGIHPLGPISRAPSPFLSEKGRRSKMSGGGGRAESER